MTNSDTDSLSGMAYRPRQTAAAAGASDAAQRREARALVGGRYLPGARLGRGRLGEIFEAADRNGSDFGIERRVAVQIIDESVMTGSTRAAELARCCAALRAAPHPNVVKILDCGRESRAFYVVMELLDGSSLRAMLDDAAPAALSADQALPIVAAVGEAVRYLHTKEMVYGAFTPENVFVKLDHSVKLLDVPLTCLPRSSPYYVEDAGDSEPHEPDPRDDVYGLACLTYELLSGRHPFNANSPLDAHRAGLTPAPIEALRPGQWAALQRALALERTKRTPTIADFLADLGATGAKRSRPSLDVGGTAGPALASARDEASPDAWPNARASAAPVPPPLPASWRSSEALAASSAYPPDEELWAPTGAKPRRRVGPTVAVVGLVAAVLGAAAVVDDNRLRGAADEAATRVRTALAAAFANGNGPSTAADAPPAEARAPDANLDSESKLAAAEEPTAGGAAAPVTAPVAVPAPVAAPAAPQAAEPTSAPPPDQVAQPGSALLPADAVPPTAPAEAQPPFVFARSAVTVSESRSAVALTIRRSGGAAGKASVVWWCRDGTAIANKDFADLGRRTETFAAGETSRTIFVPIIMDDKAEANKHFLVHLGEYDSGRRHLRVLSTVRVEIDDDD